MSKIIRRAFIPGGDYILNKAVLNYAKCVISLKVKNQEPAYGSILCRCRAEWGQLTGVWQLLEWRAVLHAVWRGGFVSVPPGPPGCAVSVPWARLLAELSLKEVSAFSWDFPTCFYILVRFLAFSDSGRWGQSLSHMSVQSVQVTRELVQSRCCSGRQKCSGVLTSPPQGQAVGRRRPVLPLGHGWAAHRAGGCAGGTDADDMDQ